MHAALVHGDGVVFLEEPVVRITPRGEPSSEGSPPAGPVVPAIDTAQARHDTANSTQRMTAYYSLRPAKLHLEKPIVIALDRDLA